MAKKSSFDVSTGVDLQEVDNAVNQARKEIATRYDFKGSDCTVEFDRSGGAIKLDADDEYRLTAVLQIVRDHGRRRRCLRFASACCVTRKWRPTGLV